MNKQNFEILDGKANQILLDEIILIKLNITTLRELKKYNVELDIVYETPFLNCTFRDKCFTIGIFKEISKNENIEDILEEKIILLNIIKEFRGSFDILYEGLNLNVLDINNLKSKFKNKIIFRKNYKNIKIANKENIIDIIYNKNKELEFICFEIYKKRKSKLFNIIFLIFGILLTFLIILIRKT